MPVSQLNIVCCLLWLGASLINSRTTRRVKRCSMRGLPNHINTPQAAEGHQYPTPFICDQESLAQQSDDTFQHKNVLICIWTERCETRNAWSPKSNTSLSWFPNFHLQLQKVPRRIASFSCEEAGCTNSLMSSSAMTRWLFQNAASRKFSARLWFHVVYQKRTAMFYNCKSHAYLCLEGFTVAVVHRPWKPPCTFLCGYLTLEKYNKHKMKSCAPFSRTWCQLMHSPSRCEKRVNHTFVRKGEEQQKTCSFLPTIETQHQRTSHNAIWADYQQVMWNTRTDANYRQKKIARTRDQLFDTGGIGLVKYKCCPKHCHVSVLHKTARPQSKQKKISSAPFWLIWLFQKECRCPEWQKSHKKAGQGFMESFSSQSPVCKLLVPQLLLWVLLSSSTSVTDWKWHLGRIHQVGTPTPASGNNADEVIMHPCEGCLPRMSPK